MLLCENDFAVDFKGIHDDRTPHSMLLLGRSRKAEVLLVYDLDR